MIHLRKYSFGESKRRELRPWAWWGEGARGTFSQLLNLSPNIFKYVLKMYSYLFLSQRVLPSQTSRLNIEYEAGSLCLYRANIQTVTVLYMADLVKYNLENKKSAISFRIVFLRSKVRRSVKDLMKHRHQLETLMVCKFNIQ